MPSPSGLRRRIDGVLMARATDITLYQFTTCPFCARVRKTLAELGLEYRAETLDPAGTVHVEGLGETTVPAIRDGDTVMNESGAIMDYLRTTYGAA